jgi:arabinan endo-1,5-alpha-L-arabinosidase
MNHRRTQHLRRSSLLGAAISASVIFAETTRAQLSGELGAHDPSSLIKDGNQYWYYATGQGIVSRTSTDQVNWSAGPSVFTTSPAWTTQHVSGFTGFFWAPDIVYFNGLYHLYYAASIFGTIDSGIGLATSPSLDNPVWTDQGKVVASQAVGHTDSYTDTTAYNAIDPSVLVDTTGNIWMSWGSYSSGIVVTQLNPTTGMRLNTSSLDATLVANNAPGGGWGSSIEASALIHHGSYYYLFVNYGGCCSGIDSTYNIRVGRGTSPTGPFVDENGVDMRNSGGTLFYDDDGNRTGPGQFAIYPQATQDLFSYHYYDGNHNGAPTYGLNNLYWTSDNWPSVAPVNPNWTGATNANWSTAANWSGALVPNGVGSVANFVDNTASRYIVNIDGGGKTLSRISFASNSNYTIGATNGSTLTLQAMSGDAEPTINVSAGNPIINAPIVSTGDLGVNVTPNGSTLTLAGGVSAGTLNKYARGELSLRGSNSFTGSVLVHAGTLDVTGSITASKYTSVGVVAGDLSGLAVHGNGNFIANGDLNIGDTGDGATPATGTLELDATGNVTVGASGGFFVGSGFFANTYAAGIVNQTGGTLTTNGNFDGAFVIGGRTSTLAVGTYNLSGGVVNANTNVRVGGAGAGTMNQTGGTFNSPAFISIGRLTGASGLWNISGGTINQSNASRFLIVGESGAGTLNVSGAAQVLLSGPLRIGYAGGAGTVNLSGGVISAPQVVRGTGIATFNFNGGLLRATANSTTFMQGLNTANVQLGGAAFDTQTFSATVAQPLLHDPSLGSAADGGLTKTGTGTLTLSGSTTYTGTTTIRGGTLFLQTAAQPPVLNNGAAGANLMSGRLLLQHGADGGAMVARVEQILSTGFSEQTPFSSGAIRSSTATANAGLGWSDDGSNTTVAYASFGDVNLDGTVNTSDFATLASHFGSTAANWSQGDFNYDGVVNALDFNLLATNFGSTLPASGSPSLGSLLPEPAGLAMVLAAAGLLRLRRRGFTPR